MSRRGVNWSIVARATIVLVAVLAVALPLLWTMRVALRPIDSFIGDPAGLGGGVTLRNFSDAWSAGLGHALLNSLLIVGLGSVVATALAALAGYGLAKEEMPGKRVVVAIAVLTLVVPLSSLAIPLFDESLQLGLLDSRPALGLMYGALFGSWGALFLRAYYASLPDELIDAAKVDGAGSWRTFVAIALPLAAPAIATVLVLNIFIQWSELLLALVMLPTTENQTASAVLAQMSTQFRAGGPLTAAGLFITVVPIVAAFAASQRWLRAEVFSGAVKG
jgi:ABC-type glycerol-3-phosphate transport system permease component